MIMQSKLFSRFDPLDDANKAFSKHLKSLADITEDQRKACVDGVQGVRLTDTGIEDDRIIQDLSNRIGLSVIKVNEILSLLSFFLSKMISVVEDEFLKGDSPEKWVADLSSLGLLTESEKPSITSTLENLERLVLPTVLDYERRQRYATGVLPFLRKLGTSVELRSIQRNEFDWTKKALDYVPEVSGLTAVASIHIGLKRADPSDVYFQVDERDLDKLINTFEALKKDIDCLKSSYKNVELK